MDCRRVDTPGRAWYALAGAAAALVPSIAMWGFTVDDALISIRYAHHLVTGAGWSFNAGAPATDGVTPLPWPFLLAPLARTPDLLAVLTRAKVLGVVAWTAGGAALGAKLGAAEGPHARRVSLLAVLALAFPVGAWAAAGMETGLATTLATLAACNFERPNRAGLLAGLAASLRPELTPWALTIAVGATIARAEARRRALALPALFAFAPFAVCTLVRVVAFGRAAPLAVLAKPSDAAHGVVYAVAAVVVALLPLLVLAPLALRRATARARSLVVALLVHALVLVAVGGDWMPFARLIVPIVPGLVLAAADVAAVAHRAVTLARLAAAATLGVYLAANAAPAGRHVDPDRRVLVASARPVLASSKVVAALDVGWVGAATEARVVDLAGLTDPSVAVLPGGHTSKAVDVAMLLDRDVDTVVLYAPPRHVEQRILRAPLFRERFAQIAALPLGSAGYAVFRRLDRAGAD
ncbi:MAG: hypothetical protein KIT84_25595 [Labilithrix sp.]|nr:hypothetical protein [Labilithrix sp.]MCW5814427.1 hypothetical protein [Labilithrix sp.]